MIEIFYSQKKRIIPNNSEDTMGFEMPSKKKMRGQDHEDAEWIVVFFFFFQLLTKKQYQIRISTPVRHQQNKHTLSRTLDYNEDIKTPLWAFVLFIIINCIVYINVDLLTREKDL